jgi:cell division transport system permease protein
MALRLDYMARETAGNIRRNLVMTSAAILTVAVSLSLVGGALLLRQGVANATERWEGGVDLSIWMANTASEQQLSAVETELESSPDVEQVTFVNKQAAYDEAQRLFANQPDMLESLTVESMPPSFRVVPASPELIRTVGDRFELEAGVQDVTYAEEEIQGLIDATRAQQILFMVVAIALLVSASLLILNTIRIAIFARRREVSVMRLVGATNWFIRIPFMFEGFLQGLLGGGIAFAAIIAIRLGLSSSGGGGSVDLLLAPSVVGTVTFPQAIGSGLLVLGVGVVVGVIGSLVAVRRFLDT